MPGELAGGQTPDLADQVIVSYFAISRSGGDLRRERGQGQVLSESLLALNALRVSPLPSIPRRELGWVIAPFYGRAKGGRGKARYLVAVGGTGCSLGVLALTEWVRVLTFLAGVPGLAAAAAAATDGFFATFQEGGKSRSCLEPRAPGCKPRSFYKVSLWLLMVSKGATCKCDPGS